MRHHPRRAEASTALCFSMACSMTPRSSSLSLSLPLSGAVPARVNCPLAFCAFPVPRLRGRVFFFLELFHGKVRHSFCGPEVPTSFPPPQAIDRERNTTRNQHEMEMENGKPDLEAIDKLSMHFNTRRETKPTNFCRAPIAGSRARHRGRRGRVGGQERGRSVGESRGAEAPLRSALRCPPPQPLNLSSFRPSCRFSRPPLQSLQPHEVRVV